jgi:hypothetical protein
MATVGVARLPRGVHMAISGSVPDRDNHPKSGQATASRRSRSGWSWWSSLWLWPAVAIGLAGLASTLFGPIGAILGGEAVAALAVTAGILLLSRDRWLTLGLAAALTISLIAVAGSVWRHESHHTSSGRTPAAPATGASTPPVDWQWRTISQAMADKANLRGADLEGANMSGLQLSHKVFAGAQADGAAFRGSQLKDANFQGASLRGACLQGADLTGANLAGADFTGADVAGVTVSREAKRAALVWPRRHSKSPAVCS